MINLTAQLCEEMDIVIWQLKSKEDDSIEENLALSHEEKELLRNILLAKGITLDEKMLRVRKAGVAEIHLPNHTLIFKDVEQKDEQQIVNLSKLADMNISQDQKKMTWFKLKNLNL